MTDHGGAPIRTGVYGLSAVATPSGPSHTPNAVGEDEADVFTGDDATRYVQLARLGEGGMGQVRLVLDARLRRQVALKVPRGTQARALLAREAFITAQLEHPGIVTVYDAGTTQAGEPFYTMRLVRGRSLEERLIADPDEAHQTSLRTLLAACEAVGFAHRAGVVHRDLKPTNVMVGDFGETIVVDWGLAMTLDELAKGPPEVAGTPDYMSPEQARGEPVDARSDVWSLGAMLYRMLSGQPPPAHRPPGTTALPTTGRDGSAPLSRDEAPQPASLQLRFPNSPRELCAIATRALAPDPARRYPDAMALAADLENHLLGRRVAAYEYSSIELLRRLATAWRVPLVIVAAALVSLAVLGILSADRIIAERDRAVAAEAEVAEALIVADTNLGRALLGLAERHRDADSGAEAELAATSALMRLGPVAPSKRVQQDDNIVGSSVRDSHSLDGAEQHRLEALGLATHFDVPRPTIAASLELPDCPRLVLDEHAELAFCLTDGVLHRLGRARPQRVTMVTGPILDAAISGGRLYVSSGVAKVDVYDAATGLLRSEPPLIVESQPRLSMVSGASDSLWLMWGFKALRHRDDRGIPVFESFAACPTPGEMVEAMFESGTSTFSLCNDGVLRQVSVVAGVATYPATLDLGVHGRAVAVAGATAFVLTESGRLLRIRLTPELRLDWSVETGLDTAMDLRISPAGGVLAIQAEGVGVTLVDPHDGRVRHRLPLAWSERARFNRTGQIVTVAPPGVRRDAIIWALPERDIAPRIGRVGAPGLATFAVGEDPTLVGGRIYVIGDGDGELRVVRESGEVIARRRFGSQVLKRVELAGERVFASSISEYQLFELDLALTDRGRLGLPGSRFRRIGVLADGTVLGADYSRPLARLAHHDMTTLGDHISVDLAVSPRRDAAVSLALDGEVALYAGGELSIIARHPGANAVALDERHVFIVTPDAVLRLDLAGAVVSRMPTGAEKVLDIATSESGHLALGRADGTTVLLAPDGSPVALFGGHSERVSQVEVRGDVVYTASWDGTLMRHRIPDATFDAGAHLVELAARWGLSLRDIFE